MSELPRIYSKPALSESQLLARWQSRGLVLPDEDRALRYLRHIGYYRLTASVRSFDGSGRDVQAAIARSLGTLPPVLSSWLKSDQRVRNICAHHGRLWNRGLGVYPALPKSRSVVWLADPTAITGQPWRRRRLYPVLVSLQTILHTISPRSTWGDRLHELFEVHRDVPLKGMGVPASWYDDPFWSRSPQ